MKIAILTSGILPVPAVQGGAVENLIDFYLAYNDKYHLHDITVYSCNHHDTKKHPALKSKVNHYYYVDTTSIIAKIRKRLYLRKAGGGELHHFSIEYFIEQVLKHLRKQSYDLILIENRPPFSLKVKKSQVQKSYITSITLNLQKEQTTQRNFMMRQIKLSAYLISSRKRLNL